MEVVEIWRYPVKSMLGEPLDQANVGPGGIQGDRRWAVVDSESGVSLSAKRYPDLLGRQVTTRSAEATETIQHEFPTAVTEGEGEPFLYKPETEAFFDCAPLQLLTTATLGQLQRLLPDSTIHPARFRPNFLVATQETGFVENNWVNNDVILGSLRCQVYDDTRRCIMVALSQGDLPRDIEVIRTILKSNEGRAGVALKTLDSSIVRRGEKVEVFA